MTDEQQTIPEPSFDFDVTPTEIKQLANRLGQAEGYDDTDPEELAEYIDALKQLESVTEDARKNVFEPQLDRFVDVGDSVGNLTKQSGTHTWVNDTEGAFAAVSDAGCDPMDVADVSISDLRDVLGGRADAFIGEKTYEYYRRQG